MRSTKSRQGGRGTKTYCKKIDISDPKQIENFVFECFSGRWKENGFINLLIRYGGMTKEQVLADAEAQDYNRLIPATAGVAAEIARRIRARRLALRPLRTFQRRDGLSGKLRDLCQATAMQQCMDYVAVGALRELFHAKISPFQCASIPGRGQGYGKRHLEKWIRRDKQARHVRKGDIKKCYASLSPAKVMELLQRDAHKNKTLLWFVGALLETHKEVTTGLAIGSYLSQWLCNYALSYLCRYLEGLEKVRHKRNGTAQRQRVVRHCLFYMDDFVIIGTRAADMDKAMKQATIWAAENLGITIKPDWGQIDLKAGAVDIMGFVVGYKGTRIRRRIYRRIRRQFLRAARNLQTLGYIPHWRARKISSYKGYFKHTNTRTATRRLDAWTICKAAQKSVSYVDRKTAQQRKELKAA